LRKTAKSILDLIEIHFASIILALLFVSVVLQVILRYVFRTPSPEFFEIAGYSFVWIIFLGAPLAQRYRKHMRFDMIYTHLPRKIQLVLDIILDTAFTVALIWIFSPILKEVLFLKFIKTDVLRIPWTYVLICFPIFIILMVIHNITWIWRYITELITGEAIKEEVPPWQ